MKKHYASYVADEWFPETKHSNKKRYIVEHGVYGEYPETVDDLQNYLDKNPYPTYNLISCQFRGEKFVLVWELKD